MAQAGLLPMNFQAAEMRAYHINRRDEDTDLYGVAGTLMATSNMQMQTFINGDSVVLPQIRERRSNCRKAAREATLGVRYGICMILLVRSGTTRNEAADLVAGFLRGQEPRPEASAIPRRSPPR